MRHRFLATALAVPTAMALDACGSKKPSGPSPAARPGPASEATDDAGEEKDEKDESDGAAGKGDAQAKAGDDDEASGKPDKSKVPLKPIPKDPPAPTPDDAPAPQPAPAPAAEAPAFGYGIYVRSQARFLLRDTLSQGAPDHEIDYGGEPCYPLLGDWNGDGLATIGIYATGAHPTDGVFMLKDALAQGAPDVTFPYGGKGTVPVVGDWDGDGKDSIGVFDATAAVPRFYLRNELSSGAPDSTIPWGQAGDLPVAGDWDGDKKFEIGVYSPRTAEFFLRKADGTLIRFQSGHASYLPVVGDWDRDGVSNVGFYAPATGEWFLLNGDGTRTDLSYGGAFAGPSLPLSGRLK